MRVKIVSRNAVQEAPVLGVALKECAAGKDLLAWDVTEPLVETHILNAPEAKVNQCGNDRLKTILYPYFPYHRLQA